MRIEVLGSVRALVGGSEVELGGPQQRLVLALLVEARGRVVTTDQLVDRVWGEELPDNARKTIQIHVSKLRKAFGERAAIETTGGGYRLQRDLEVDVEEFERLVADGRTHLAHQPEQAAEVLRQALAMWRGPPYADLRDEEALQAEIGRLEEFRLGALEGRLEADIAVGDATAAVAELDGLIDRYPLRERLRALHMTGLYRTGRQTEALRSYQQLRARLGEDIGIDPSPELQQLEQRILDHDLTLEPAAAGDLPSETATFSRPNNLPAPLTSFVGRESDLVEVGKLLAGARLVTLTGAGGSGKTRLALQQAGEALDDYGDGVWFVELAPVTGPEGVPRAVEAVLGAKEEPGRQPIEIITASIGAKAMLLVLDNCEHVVGGVADLAASLLARCPNLTVLATSREMLGVPGEVLFAVESLALPPPDAHPEAVAFFDSVKLFAERVASSKPGFQLTTAEAPAAAHICRMLDGMPLALELAASRMRAFSVEQIAARLDDRLGLLTSGARTAHPRQQTMMATIDWSYHLLDHGEQRLFQSLSVFVGGFSLEMAEAICGGAESTEHEVADAIHQLVDKSLVIVREQPDGSVRYQLLETLREYGAGKLAESGRGDEIAALHARAFAALVGAQDRLKMTRDWAAAMDLLTAEHGNIRAALRWSLDRGLLDQLTMIGTTMGNYWRDRGLSLEGLDWVGEILNLIPTADRSTVATFVHTAATLHYIIGDYESAKKHYAQALALRRELEDAPGVVRALNGLAFTAGNTGDYEDERAYFEEALDITRSTPSIGFSEELFVAGLGWTAWKSDDIEAAREYLETALDQTDPEVARNLEDYLLGLAFVEWAEGDFEEAENLARRALDLAREQGLKLMAAGYQFAVALFELEQGKAQVAAETLRQSWPVIVDSKEGMWVPHWLYVAARAQPDAASSVRIFAAVAATNARTGFMFGIPTRKDVKRSLARARGVMDEEEFDRAWAVGSAATVEEAGTWALEGLEQLDVYRDLERERGPG